MSEKHALANKRRWSKIPKRKRSKMMRDVAKEKASKMSEKERKEHSLMMNTKKREKKQKTK
jgi:hypothetical protein